nr:MAG TPA: hypothetical protein [Caudoviricetes sp.]
MQSHFMQSRTLFIQLLILKRGECDLIAIFFDGITT